MTTDPPGDWPFADPRRTALDQNGEAWDGSRILRLARAVSDRLPRGVRGTVAIRSRAPAFVEATLLAVWTKGCNALLLDPVLSYSWMASSFPEPVPTLTPADEADGRPGEIPVGPPADEPLAPARPRGNDPFLTVLTSGSTGEPKLVPKRWFQFERQFETEREQLGLSDPFTVLSLVPVHHILGFMYGIFYPLSSAGSAAFSLGTTPPVWLRRIRRLEPKLVVGVPSQYRLLVPIIDRPLPQAVYLSSGAPLPEALGREFQERAGSPIVQVFGSTESGGIALRTGDDPWRPIPPLRFRVDDADQRLWVAAPWLEQPDVWTPTDDAAVADADGFKLVGRVDSVVKVGGRRFSTDEIVRAAQTIPGVDQSVAVIYHRYGEPALALFVTPKSGATLTMGTLRDALSQRLVDFKMPRTLCVLDALPTRGIGKVDLEALRRRVDSD